MTEPTICEIAFVESLEHPVIKQIELGIEKTIVRLERCTEETAFLFQLGLQRCARVRQHATEACYRPPVANESLQEVDIVTHHLESGVRIQQHEPKIKREAEAFQYLPRR